MLDMHTEKKPPHREGWKSASHAQGRRKQVKHLQVTNTDYTLRQLRAQAPCDMLDHLLDYSPPISELTGYTRLEEAQPTDIISAQDATAKWLEQMGAPTADTTEKEAAAAFAQQAFAAVTTTAPDPAQRQALVKLKTPPAVRHLVGMLTAYDWAFVEQAKELRGYAVSQILEETKHPDAKVRLKALEMLGKVTEVALFTNRVEIKSAEMSDTELDQKIKDKLNRFMGVLDAEVVEAEETQAPNDEAV